MLVDIDSTTTATSFALGITSVEAVALKDNNSLLPISIANSGSFPLITNTCRIDIPSQEMLVAYETSSQVIANYGQKDFSVLKLLLRHPGDAGYSQIQMTEFSLTLLDENDIAEIEKRVNREYEKIAERAAADEKSDE